MKTPIDVALVGGGSGGHITPLVSVAEALRETNADRGIVHIGHKNDPLNSVTRESAVIDEVYEVQAGKFRRYHGQSRVAKLFDVKTLFFNVRDFFRFLVGIYQAWRLLGKLQPRVIFMKGGYVCANVGIAARLRRIPYITHDSDAMVSLAHKIIAKRALYHLTALPAQYYAGYDQTKVRQVGVPVKAVFQPVSDKEKQEAKKTVDLSANAQVVLVTGGGLGAHNINQAILDGAEELLKGSNVFVIHLTGGKTYEDVTNSYKTLNDIVQSNVRVEAFTDHMQVYSAAADVIVSRASMTALTEFGVQQKACIIVPNPVLSGGHQLENAQSLSEQQAVSVVAEDDLHTKLVPTIKALLNDPAERQRLAKALSATVLPDAAKKIATILDDVKR